MTNEQKAAMLEEIADLYIRIGDRDVALLREAAEMMRERGKVQWMKVAGSDSRQMALYRGWFLEVGEDVAWNWLADSSKDFFEENLADSLEAAQAAAVAWVDEQEGRNV